MQICKSTSFLSIFFVLKIHKGKRYILAEKTVQGLVQLYRAKGASRLKFKHMNSDPNQLNYTTALFK